MDYGREQEPVVPIVGDFTTTNVQSYQYVDTLHMGQFSSVCRVVLDAPKKECEVEGPKKLFAAKVLLMVSREEQVREELEILCTLQHSRIAALHEAYSLPYAAVLLQELLSGVDVLTYLGGRHQYTEHTVTTIVTQVLDALSYLQWRGVSHLDLQPDNVVMTSLREPSVKLVDFAAARRVEFDGTKVNVNGLTEFIAPEVLFDGMAFPNTDIWSLGVLAYVLMTGVGPFAAATEDELKDNIQCVRYRFEHLPSTATQEATRFLMLIFKRSSDKRPTVNECLEHRWLHETDFMVRKRERANIMSYRVQEYADNYHHEKAKLRSTNALLLNFAGLKV